MGAMDTTRNEELLTRLEAADPAEAPDVADELAAALAQELDGGTAQPAAETGSPAPAEPGGAP